MLDKVFHLLTEEYKLVLATTQEDFQAVEAIRNDVIVNHYPEIEETKEYIFNQDDEQSYIYLLQHQATKRYIGSARIFFVNERTPTQEIPMQKDLHIKNIEHFTQDLPIAEISRFALVKNQVPHKDFSELRLRTYLSLLLMSATRISVFLNNYSKIFAIMELSLHRILKRQSVILEPIGDAIDFHGVRFPFVMKKEDFLFVGEKTKGTMGELTKYYLKELCKNPESFWQFIDNNPYLERSDIQLDRICQFFKEFGDDTSIEFLLEKNDLSTTV
ncbi:MAG: hypothetical protein COB07_02190 [Sulfurovum sp.]|nr:MAG: hypothetical protein COB07_02190 [Sulfurovum sp.]